MSLYQQLTFPQLRELAEAGDFHVTQWQKDVYFAQSEAKQQKYVIKKTTPEGIRALGVLTGHPNAVQMRQLIEVIRDKESKATTRRQYAVLDYVDGMTIDEALDCKERFGVKRIITIAAQLVSIIERLHSRNIVYRDWNGTNVITAKQASSITVIDMENTAPVGSHTIAGTPGFYSPEHYQTITTKKMDVWGIGAILYYIVTKETPTNPDKDMAFHAETQKIIKQAQLDNNITTALRKIKEAENRLATRPASIKSGNKSVDDIINSAMHPDETRRPTTTELRKKIIYHAQQFNIDVSHILM